MARSTTPLSPWLVFGCLMDLVRHLAVRTVVCSDATEPLQFRTSGEGDALQRSLLDYSSDKDSYVEEFWDDSFLTPKTSVVLNLK